MEFEICLKDLKFYAFHGVFEEERRTGNEFKVNLKIYLPYKEEIEKDDLSQTISYSDLYDIVKEEMQIPRKLLETVSASIVKKIKGKYPFIRGGRIEVEKMHPPIPGMLGSSSVALNF